MGRILVVQISLLSLSTLAFALEPPVSRDSLSQPHSSAQIKDVRGVRHGYRYQVQFPTTQKKSEILDNYRSEAKYEDNTSVGTMNNEKYTNGYENNRFMDPVPVVKEMKDRKTIREESIGHYDSHFSSQEPKKIDTRQDGSSVNGLLELGQSSFPSPSQDFAGQSVRKPEMYLPPVQTESPVSKENEGYYYDKPSNQFALPTENKNQEYVMSYPWTPAPSSDSKDDDSVEIVPPPDSQLFPSFGDNRRIETYNPTTPEQITTESPTDISNNNYPSFNQYPNAQTVTGNSYNHFTSPSKQSHEDYSNKNKNEYPNKYGSESGNADEVLPKTNPEKNSKTVGNEFQYAQIKSPEPKSEVDDLTETSLMVHFAGSVFHTDGLPHPSTDLVFPVEYIFSYDLRGWPRLGHEETRAEHTTRGRYWVTLPDGRMQVVEYTAGPHGFVPIVSYRSPDQETINHV